MKEINLLKLSELISQKLDKKVEFIKIEKIGSGYHSDGFKLSSKGGDTFFLKRVKSHDLGFELPERQISSLLISDGMGKRSGLSPRPVGVVIVNDDEEVIVPDIDGDLEIYHIQEFGVENDNYWSRLQKKKDKIKIDKEDIEELDKISDLIVKIHSTKYPSDNSERLKSVYNDGLRAVLVHPELTVMFLHDFTEKDVILPPSKQGEFVGLMLDLIHKWKNKTDRLCALHGDFWGANLFFKPDDSAWITDFSRIPWGDPGIDVGWWLSQYLWFYHETKNPYFKELGEAWLNIYEKKTGDKEIREHVCLILGLMGIIFVTPRFYPDLNVEIGERFFENIWQILKEQKFTWKD